MTKKVRKKHPYCRKSMFFIKKDDFLLPAPRAKTQKKLCFCMFRPFACGHFGCQGDDPKKWHQRSQARDGAARPRDVRPHNKTMTKAAQEQKWQSAKYRKTKHQSIQKAETSKHKMLRFFAGHQIPTHEALKCKQLEMAAREALFPEKEKSFIL